MQAIFIHSLFRTGSTYIWNKFRKSPLYKCYYEPLHNELLGIKPIVDVDIDKDKFGFNNHPKLDLPYFWEYNDFIYTDGGVKNFKQDFVAMEFCFNGDNKDLKTYIDTLLEHSDGLISVLQFNRSALRTKWFKENYVNVFNIYLIRNARDNFMSFEHYLSKGNTFFSAMDLVFISYNLTQPIFKWLLQYIELEPAGDNIDIVIKDAMGAVSKLPCIYRYLMFYTIWYSALVFNTFYADMLLDVNRLTEDLSYRNEVTEILAENEIYGITFDDANLNRHNNYTLDNETMLLVENLVKEHIDGVVNYGK